VQILKIKKLAGSEDEEGKAQNSCFNLTNAFVTHFAVASLRKMRANSRLQVKRMLA
jgi:hypothetical protein